MAFEVLCLKKNKTVWDYIKWRQVIPSDVASGPPGQPAALRVSGLGKQMQRKGKGKEGLITGEKFKGVPKNPVININKFLIVVKHA